jgi:hypothetical protein
VDQRLTPPRVCLVGRYDTILLKEEMEAATAKLWDTSKIGLEGVLYFFEKAFEQIGRWPK